VACGILQLKFQADDPKKSGAEKMSQFATQIRFPAAMEDRISKVRFSPRPGRINPPGHSPVFRQTQT